MSKPTLHGVFLSGPTYKAGLMLSLTGTPFAYRHVDLRAGKHKAPDFLKLNRYGQVPCLEIDGMALCQSGAILEYLAEKTGKLRGADPLTRARAREWIFWDFDRLTPGIYRVRAAELGFRQFPADVVADLKVQGKAALDVLEGELKGRDWLAGKEPTIADVDVYGVVRYAPDGKYDLGVYPGIQAWLKRVEGLPGWKAPEDLLPKQDQA